MPSLKFPPAQRSLAASSDYKFGHAASEIANSERVS